MPTLGSELPVCINMRIAVCGGMHMRASICHVRMRWLCRFSFFLFLALRVRTKVCVDMCADICADMRIDICIDTCIGMCTGMCIGMCIGTCAGMCMDMRIGMCIVVRLGMCMAMWSAVAYSRLWAAELRVLMKFVVAISPELYALLYLLLSATVVW